MGDIAVIGADALIVGFALAGAMVYPADTPDAARRAWRSLPERVELVILTGAAAAAVPETSVSARLVAVIPG